MRLTTAKEIRANFQSKHCDLNKNETLDQVAWETTIYPPIENVKNSDKHLQQII